MRFFRPRIERFEARQLMASDVEPALYPQLESTSYSVSTLGVTEQSTTTAAASNVDEFAVSNPIIDYFGDAVAARTGTLTVIASRAHSQLMVIDESTASPKIAFRLELGWDFGIQDLKVAGNRAIVFGQSNTDHTQVMAIDLSVGKIVNRVELPPGTFSYAHFTGSDAWLVLSKAVKPAVSDEGLYTLPNDSSLMHFQWGDAGLVSQSSLSVAEGQWAAADNRLIMVTSDFLGGLSYNTTVHLYDISQANLMEMATLELENGFSKSIAISSDGRRASLIRGVLDEPQAWVELLDLSDVLIRVVQSIHVEGWIEVYKHDADVAVLTAQGARELVSVDLRSEAAPQSRKQSWVMPGGYSVDMGLLTLSHGRLGIPAYVYNGGPFFGETRTSSNGLDDGTYVLVADPNSTAVQVVRIDEQGGRFFSIEPGTNRIGIWSFTGVVSVFTYGELDEQGFVKQGVVSGFMDARRDLPLIAPDRLLTASSDQVAIYDLEDSGKSLLISSVTEPAITLKAVDFDIRVPRQGMNIYPAAVDISWLDQERIRLVSLEGAPADVQIANPRMIAFAAYEEIDRPPVDFEYVISNGISQARGRIHVVFSDDIMPVTVSSEDNSTTKQLTTNSSSGESIVMIRHNSADPLDVNEDGVVTVIDVLQVVNAINHGPSLAATFAIDTNGDGLLQAIDVLLVINYLNRDVVVASPPVATMSEAELVEIRAIALKAELARAYSTGQPPQAQLLVGFAPMPSPPREYETAVYYTYPEIVNQEIQKIEPLPDSLLSQAGIQEFKLGSPKLAIYRDGPVQNVNTDEPVRLIKVERPRDDDEGKISVEIVHNFGTPDGVSAFKYLLQKVNGQWKIVGFEPTYIS